MRSFSRSPSFCINLTLFDRRPLHEDVVNLVGDFTSTSILECAPGEGSALADRLRALQQRMWSDMDHSLFSGVEVLRELNRHQGGSRAQMPVVFTSGLVFAGQGAGLGALDAGHQEAGAGESYSIGQTSQVWMDLMALNSGGGLLLYLDAVDALFPAGMVDALFEVLCGLIERIAVDETLLTRVRVAELPAADADSRRVYNDTDVDWDIPPLHGPALMCSHRGPALLGELRTIGHAELRRSVGTLAANLKSAGVCRGDAVGVMMHKGAEQVLACLAILSLGAYYVPVDSHQPPDRREGLLRQVGTRTVLVQPGAAQEGIPDGVLRIDVSMDVPGPPAPGVPESAADPNDLAYVIFTSGSTGMPKGVAIDHRGASNTCVDVNRRFGINAGDRALALSALNFDLSVWDMFGVLGAGGAMVIPDADRLREPGHWLDLIYQHQVSVINAVPALVQMLIDHLEIGQLRLPESVRLIMMSGDWIPVNLPARIRAVSSADIQLISMGGATEASIWSIWYPIQAVPANWKSIPYGMPLANQRFHVLHADLSPCPTHVVGDLYIGGIGLAKGYFGDPERTAASFVVHPDTGERLYRTGDLGRFLADGMIEFLGREDGQVKVQGHRIELSEVEANLLAHPEVQEAAVDARGQGAARALYGWIVPRARPQEDGYAPAQSSFGPVLVDPVERSLFKFQRRGVRSSNGDVLVFSEDDSRRLLPAPVLDESGQLRFEQLGQLLSRFRAYPITDGGLPKYYYPSAGSLYPVQLYLQLNGDAVPGVAGGGYYYDPHQHALVKVSAEVSATAHICVHAVAELDAIAPLYGDLSLAFSELEAGYLSALLPPIHHHGCWQSQVAGSDLQAALGLSTSQRALRSWEWQANTPLDPDSLANPDLAGMSLFARQSFRTFDESTLPAVELSLLQEALAEIVGVEALLLVKPGRVEGVAGGLYRVDGAALTLLSADHIALSEVFDVGAASLFGKAAFAWFLAGEDSPSGRIRIGHAAGRLSAAAAVAGTGLCAVGTFDSRPIQSLVDALQRLDGGTRLVQHALLGGGVPESAKLSRSEPVSEGRSDLASAIQSFLRTRLPDYMVPKTLFLLERMPLSSNGKVDRKAMELPERPVAEAQTGTPLADRIDMALAALWEEVLGVRPHAREDNFVALGGNSISLVQIFTRLRAHHGVQVSLRQLFESPTFAFMRELLLRAGGVGEAQGHEHALIAQLRELRLRQWLAQMSERELDERLGELAREAE
ncbi:hypothetical protein ASG87_16805 [Frateuria sp. Soil773]|nr:hypothetical protein ASG87_16805 [Frateuria sp. Soil773]